MRVNQNNYNRHSITNNRKKTTPTQSGLFVDKMYNYFIPDTLYYLAMPPYLYRASSLSSFQIPP